jgi:two-component system, chemotaxis family, protein-glutamate methylesterase/glutaminase
MSVRDIIVVGTSRGGLEALVELLSGLPGELIVSVLIVLHTAPESPQFLADILGQYTPLKVAYGQHGHSVEARHIYLAPPDHPMTVLRPGCLRLDQGPKVHFSRPAVDPLFRTAAEVYGPRVIGVVLTGTAKMELTGCSRSQRQVASASFKTRLAPRRRKCREERLFEIARP